MEIKKSFLKENWLLILSIIYMISPVDLVPDFIPILGKLDDSIVILLELFTRYRDYKKPTKQVEDLKRVDDKTFRQED